MRRCLLLVVALIVLGQTWAVQAGTFDIVHGLYLNKPAADSGIGTSPPGTGTLVQTGQDGWWYYTHAVGGFGATGPLSAAQMNPAAYTLSTAGRDGVGDAYSYGNVSTEGGRPWVANGTWDNGSDVPATLNGLTEGTALHAAAHNFNQSVIEWRASKAGSYDVAYEFDAWTPSDMEWHIFQRVDGVSTELAYSAVLGAGSTGGYVGPIATASSPVVLSASGLSLSPGDSIFLYGRVMDHDGDDGTGIRGFIYVPEPTAAMLLLVGSMALGLRRRTRL